MGDRRAEIASLLRRLAERTLGDGSGEPTGVEPEEEDAGFEVVAAPCVLPVAAPQVVRDVRFYCVWRFPEGAAAVVEGIGIYSGEFPAVWTRILSQAGATRYAGSGIQLRRYNSLRLARDAWLTAAPAALVPVLPADAPHHRI